MKKEPVELVFYAANGDNEATFNNLFGNEIRKKFPDYDIEFLSNTAGTRVPELLAAGTRIDIAYAGIGQHKEEFALPEGTGWGSPIPGNTETYMYAGTRVYHANSADGEQLTYSEMEGRRQVRAIMDLLRKYAAGDKMTLLSLPSYIGTRETRHITCQYCLTGEDVLYGRPFEDAIANGSYRVDIHHQEKPGLTFKYLDGIQVYSRNGYPSEVSRWRDEIEVNPTFYQIPYRSLVPEGPYPNVIVAGRMLDIDDEAFGGVRVMVNMNQLGEASGVAAYLALQHSKPFVDIDASELRDLLSQGGSLVI